MAAMIDHVTIQVRPDHHMFGLSDADTAEDPWPAVPESPEWVSVTRSALLIETGQDGVAVTVRLQVWDAPPATPSDDAELSTTVALHLPSGVLDVNEITGGWRPDVLRLPHPGDYHAKLSAYRREQTSRAYDELFARYAVTDAAFESARRELEGNERYAIAFWPQGS